MKLFWVYIMASGMHGTLYIGVTSDLLLRVSQHKDGTFGGFTDKYDVKRLVYYEEYGDAESAIRREKQLKKYEREWKINLIEQTNPQWDDLLPAIAR